MSRRGFHYCTGRHSCPVCGDTAGRCRTRDELVLCMSSSQGEAAGDLWHYLGPNKGSEPGTWGLYVPFDERRRKRNWRETYLDDIQNDLAADALREGMAKLRARPRPAAPVLRPGYSETPTATIEQRHEAYTALFRAWELAPHHRRNLSDRYGFPITDANRHLIGTVSVNSVVSHDWHRPFPGAGPDHTASFPNGMALAITDEQQRILGVEIRRDDPTGGRYRWLSRPEHCELGIPEYGGENPLGIYAPVRPGLQPEGCTGSDLIAISEGRGMKPRICASRWGCPVIGGGGHAAATGSPIQLNRYLHANRGATVLLLVDAGGLANHRVVRQLLLLILFCRQRGHEVLIPWWSQHTAKTDPDPDEVPHTHGVTTMQGGRYAAWDDGRNIPLWQPETLGLEV